MTKGVLRFFFDYGSGCLWSGDAKTLDLLDVGPVDSILSLSEPVRELTDRILFMQSCYLNPLYPPDPSLWSESLCDRFNGEVDSLIQHIRQEIGEDYDILDQQERYAEDVRLTAYLLEHPELEKQDEATQPTVS
ncbi:hypothetical protein [Falsigemmobacter faecalis]|uniref:Uncharacterized protein n=1 Tax=Falsigemmobacter faecalis TaxID=2488730 RepID=A0A3P3D7G9_9RHOB|nr:hypothetical protein [Falsigemmobacter faecalis]RRH70101.1 hypothetical protein EG244_17540 [Falsigemmobacter faecalis]